MFHALRPIAKPADTREIQSASRMFHYDYNNSVGYI